MSDKTDVVKDEIKKKTLEAKNKADELKEKTAIQHEKNKIKAEMIKEDIAVKSDNAQNKALEVKNNALKKTGEIKDSAIIKSTEIKENAAEKTSQLKEDTAEKNEEFKENAEKTRKQAESRINEFISTLKDKQEEIGKSISDYTSAEKPLVDVIDTDNTIIIKADIPRVKKDDITVHITEDSVEIIVQFEEEKKELNFIKKERSYGKTSRIIPLPEKIEVKKSSAKFKKSILTVELPKIKEEKFKVDIE